MNNPTHIKISLYDDLFLDIELHYDEIRPATSIEYFKWRMNSAKVRVKQIDKMFDITREVVTMLALKDNIVAEIDKKVIEYLNNNFRNAAWEKLEFY